MTETIVENLTNYELMLILPPGLGEENSLKEFAEIKNLITSESGEVYHEDVWGVRPFAYTIKKHDEGFYIVLNFKLEGKKIGELENELNLNQKVLRYLISKIPKNYEIKTLEEYQEMADKEAAEKKKNEKSASKPKAAPKPKKKVVKKEEPKKEEMKKIPKEEAAEVKEEKKVAKSEDKKENLEDLDAKLKSIINDPDISL